MFFDDFGEMLATATFLSVSPYLATALWEKIRFRKGTRN